MNPDSNTFQPGNQPATPAPAGPTPPTPPVAPQTTPAQPAETVSEPLDRIAVPSSEPEIPLEADGFPVMPEPPKKKNTTRIVLIVILVLAIIGCGVAAAIVLMNPSKSGGSGGNSGAPTSNPDTPDAPDTPDTTEEVALTDETILSDINNKLGILMGVNWENSHAEASGIIFRDVRVLTEGSLEQSEKAFSVLSNMQSGILTDEQKQAILKDNDEYFTAIANYRADKSVENARAEFGNMTVTYNAGPIREEYKKVYGEELPKGATIDSKSCGYFGYNEAFDIYFMESGCGGASTPRYYYANKYTTDDSNVYVYISAGFVSDEESGVKLYCNLSEYGNVTANSQVCGEINATNTGSANSITAENYQNFSQYRVKFTKNTDGSYYFSSAESL